MHGKSRARTVNAVISALIGCFFIAHALLGGASSIAHVANTFTVLVWTGAACVVVHILCCALTSKQMLGDAERPPSDKKKRHLALKWVTGSALLVLAAVHIYCMVNFGAEAVQAHVAGTLLSLCLILVLAVHLCVGSKSLLKDLGIDRRFRPHMRIAVCCLAALAAVLVLFGVLTG